jgi:hypothetical protein
MNILILSEKLQGKYGLYSAIDAVPLPDGTFMLPERCLSDVDLIAAKDLIIEKRTATAEILPLPDEGELIAGNVYQWYDPDLGEDQNINYICRQTHNRTIYKPSETPALFTFYRENSDDLIWIQNELVELGWKRVHNGVQYECIQAHMTVEGQTPDITPALWLRVSTGIEEWRQPTGAHDAYNIGDQVTFNGQTYESTINANVWAPDVYGWNII